MRKVLFATTALVALGGVSAATADISVSAGNEMQYKSWSSSTATTANNNSVTNKTSYKISASTVTDNGLTLSSYTAQDGTTSGNVGTTWASRSPATSVRSVSQALSPVTRSRPPLTSLQTKT